MSVVTGDLWRVRIAPDEEKVLTLEQIDDLYRLEMIDENTLLWQEGMAEWLPLKVVAGLGEEEAEPSTLQVPPPAPLPAPLSSLPRPPAPLPAPLSSLPRPPAPLPLPLTSLRPPEAEPSHRDTLRPGWTEAPAPTTEPPPPPSARRAPTPAPSPGQSAPPWSAPPRPSAPPLGSARPPLSAAPSPHFEPAALPHLAPVAVPQSAEPARGSRVEVVLLGLTVLLGLLLTLHRNGLLHALSATAGAGVEEALGGPGFGTLRAVDALVAKTPKDASKP
ncbi:MAG: DUF4339 domain-containing protein [Pseudomonadota bacterium]